MDIRRFTKTETKPERFGPKTFKTYYNIPGPAAISQGADSEIPLERVYGEWPVSTDPDVHAKAARQSSHFLAKRLSVGSHPSRNSGPVHG